jgi:hypothetical protein
VVLLLITSRFTRVESFNKIIKFFASAGAFNIVYSIAASNGYDLFSWSNPYNSVLGTFGNPNFIGAFMGIFATILFVQLFSNLNSQRSFVFILISIVLTIYVILLTNALQGILLAAFGFSFSLYFYLRFYASLLSFLQIQRLS